MSKLITLLAPTIFAVYALGYIDAPFSSSTNLSPQTIAFQPSNDDDNLYIDVALIFQLDPNNPRTAEFIAVLNSLQYFRSCLVRLHFVTVNGFTEEKLLSWAQTNKPLNMQVFLHVPPKIDFQTGFREAFASFKIFPELALPSWVKRVIIIGADMIWARDICRLYSEHFANFNPSQMLALAPEQTDWFQDPKFSHYAFVPESEDHVALPAQFPKLVGLNSGIILADLDRMRTWDWSRKVKDMRRSVEAEAPPEDKLFPLGDQDVFNMMAKQHREIVKVLPPRCNWQFMLPCKNGVPNDVFVFHGTSQRFLWKDPDQVDSQMGMFIRNIWQPFTKETLIDREESTAFIDFKGGHHIQSWC